MKSIVKYIRSKGNLLLPVTFFLLPVVTSCSDFFDQDSDKLVFTDKATLDDPSDTLFSVTGVVNKLQKIGDRTILLGEMRGDLVDVNSNTSADLRDVALFNVGTDNAYNSIKDYYAVINNCNYFIAKADTALKNERNEYIFMKEYAAVKAFRAWTYLQMVLNYGEVEFVTEPVLTKEEADKNYETKDIQGICNYFIKDLQGLENIDAPGYGTIRNTDSHLFYFPIYALLGDLNLWAGNYKTAALDYYKFLTTRDGQTNAVNPMSTDACTWGENTMHWSVNNTFSWQNTFEEEQSGAELITMIPGDSIPSEGNYSQLRNLFNTNENNEYKESIDPSARIQEISSDQDYCYYLGSGDPVFVPKTLSDNLSGDLRLSGAWTTQKGLSVKVNGKKVESVSSINKYETRNIHLYRLTMVYLRMAEALNRAGYPRFAFEILSRGLTNSTIQEDVIPAYPADSAWIAQFDFPNTKYIAWKGQSSTGNYNTMGIHSRGCGYTPLNANYTFPEGCTLEQQEDSIEDKIMTEEALEFAFEGHRFYDLMRVALRRNDPAYLADRIYMRKGKDNISQMKSEIKVDLYDKKNWYLKK